MSTMGQETSPVCRPGSASRPPDHSVHPEQTTLADDSSFGMVRDHGRHLSPHPPSLSFFSYPPPHCFAVGYSPPTPFPSQANGSWLHPSFASSWSGYPKSLPSYLNQKDFSCSVGSGGLSGGRSLSLSLPGSASMSSLEQPQSLCSNPPSASLLHHDLPPYSCPAQGAGCCAQRPAESFSRRAGPSKPLWPQHHPANATCCEFS